MLYFFKAAGIRALRTAAQTALSLLGVGNILGDVDWLYVLSATALAALLSLLTSLVAGLPEVPLQRPAPSDFDAEEEWKPSPYDIDPDEDWDERG